VGKTRAATGQGSVESSARVDRVESDARKVVGRKKVMGCRKERGEVVEDIRWAVCSSD
jgi:hypothetical protein